MIAHDMVYPAIHGGRVDMWNRLRALSSLGAEIDLISWTNVGWTKEDIKEIEKYAKSINVIPLAKIGIFRKLCSPYPSIALGYDITDKAYEELFIDICQRTYNAVILEGLFAALPALYFAEHLNIPLIYRSQNVEYQYIKELCKAEKRLYYKFALWRNIESTRKLEQTVRKKSSLVYDISENDASHWRKTADLACTRILNPVLYFPEISTPEQTTSKDIDVLFLGNLYTPNNLYGVNWFLKKVMIHLTGLNVAFAGSRPSDDICLAASKHGVTIVANPLDVQELYERSKVLINPIWHGSGINIKIIEMLATGLPVVSTSIGARGLMDKVVKYVSVEDSPQGFATAILSKVNNAIDNAIDAKQKEETMQEYHWKNSVMILQEIESLMNVN